MGARLMVGQRTLDPYVEVQILRPQPLKIPLSVGGFFKESNFL